MRTPLTVGVVGLDGWGGAIVHAFEELPGADLRWLCDPRRERGWLQRQAPAAAIAPEPEHLLRDDDLDAVVIAATGPERRELVLRALESGKHVLVRPPLAPSGDLADELVRQAERYQRLLMAGHLAPFHAGALKLKEVLRQGRLGELYYLCASRHELGAQPGGILHGLGGEAVAALLYLVSDEPIEVTARGGSYAVPDLVDVAFCHLTFATGIAAEIRVSALEARESRRLLAVGSRATAVVEEIGVGHPLMLHERGDAVGDAAGIAPFNPATPGDLVAPRVAATAATQALCEHFLAAAWEPVDSWAGGREAAAVVAVLDALERSLARGGRPQPVGGDSTPVGPASVIPMPLRSA